MSEQAERNWMIFQNSSQDGLRTAIFASMQRYTALDDTGPVCIVDNLTMDEAKKWVSAFARFADEYKSKNRAKVSETAADKPKEKSHRETKKK